MTLPRTLFHDEYMSRHVFGSLNGLRFLCIAAVMWHHSPLAPALSGFQLAGRGFVGVDFFFILSGFLITTLLLREERATGRISLRNFYGRRALRILPAYLLLVTAISAYWIVVKGQVEMAGMVPYYYAFLANFLTDDIPLLSVTWSLSIEEQYYLIWPALLLLPLPGRARIALLTAAILLCLFWVLGLPQVLHLPVIETSRARFTLPAMPYQAILMGSLLAMVLNDARGFRAVARLGGGRWAAPLWLAVLVVFLQIGPGDLTGWPSLAMDLLMALALAALVLREDHALRPFLTLPPVARIGAISYGLYLYHLIGLHVAHQAAGRLGLTPGAEMLSVSIIFVAVSVLMAELSYRCYESRFLRLKPARIRRAGPLRPAE